MSNIGFPIYDIQAVDPKTGRWTREWWIFFQLLWERAGGSSGQSSSDLSLDMPEDAGAEELKATVYSLKDEAEQIPTTVVVPTTEDPSGEIGALREAVFLLSARLDALEQGMSL